MLYCLKTFLIHAFKSIEFVGALITLATNNCQSSEKYHYLLRDKCWNIQKYPHHITAHKHAVISCTNDVTHSSSEVLDHKLLLNMCSNEFIVEHVFSYEYKLIGIYKGKQCTRDVNKENCPWGNFFLETIILIIFIKILLFITTFLKTLIGLNCSEWFLFTNFKNFMKINEVLSFDITIFFLTFLKL